jgi:hypothetical protein
LERYRASRIQIHEEEKMRSIVLAAVVALACGAAGFAVAAPDTHDGAAPGASALKAAFGNTVVETYPDGRKAAIWLEPNGVYTGQGRRHEASDGHWVVKAGQLCFHQAHPFAFGVTYCTPIPQVGLGQPWQAKAVTGEEITVRVEPGHVTPG